MDFLPKKKSDVQFNGIIKFNDIKWKEQNAIDVQKEFNERLNEIKENYDKLMEEVYYNQLLYSTEINFEPVIGQIYHLYKRDNGITFLSLIGPNEWNMNFIDSFYLKHNKKWEKCTV